MSDPRPSPLNPPDGYRSCLGPDDLVAAARSIATSGMFGVRVDAILCGGSGQREEGDRERGERGGKEEAEMKLIDAV